MQRRLLACHVTKEIAVDHEMDHDPHTCEPIVDVLVGGAGPVGTTLACELLRWGVGVRVLDRKEGPERYLKAANLWQRTQEVFAAMGLLDKLLAQATPLHTFSVHGYGELLDHIPQDRQESPCPVPAFIGQNQIERTLWDHLAEAGCAVEAGTMIVGVREHGDHVAVEVERYGGAREVVRARYLAACDGSKSAIRDLAGLGFTPAPLSRERILRQVDARLVRWSRTIRPGHASFFIHDSGYLGALPLPRGLYRFFLVTDAAGVPDRNPTLDEMQAAIRTVAGDPAVELADPDWFSHGRYAHGVAPSYRSPGGRVLLVGDAGHVTIPIYGQGMNTGMQDAFNLGWKLALTLRGAAPAALLDSYECERRAVRAALDREQVGVWQFMTEPRPLQRQAVRWLGATAMSLGLERYFEKRTSQLAIAYPDSPLSRDRLGGGHPCAGERAPDAAVVAAPGLATTTLFADLYRRGWTLLLFDGGGAARHAALHATAAAVEARFPSVRARPVLSALNEPGSGAIEGPALLDLDRFAHQAYGLGQAALVLVRPDGYVAFRGRLRDHAALFGYCDEWVGAEKVAA